MRKIRTLLVVVGILLAPMALAKDANNSQGATNGQPFLQLQAAIDAAQSAAAAALAAEEAARVSGDDALAAALQAEASVRAAADAAEAAARSAADAAEAAARAAADANLQGQIDVNADAIATNAAAIAQNSTDIASAMASIQSLNSSLGSLTGRVGSLESDMGAVYGLIADLQASDGALQTAIDQNADLLSDLRLAHNADVASLQSRISDANAAIAQLSGELASQVAQLNQTINNLSVAQAGINAAQDANIAGLQSQAIGLLADIASINVTLTSHSTSLSQLSAQLAAAGSAINALGAQLAALEDRVETLECLPGHPADPCSVRITAPGEAYGHHGACSGWNGCGDAATCAQWACEVKGYSQVVSFGEDRPCTEFSVCHLFHSRGSVDFNWGNWCGVRGVTDIECK